MNRDCKLMNERCGEEGCREPVFWSGLCHQHYLAKVVGFELGLIEHYANGRAMRFDGKCEKMREWAKKNKRLGLTYERSLGMAEAFREVAATAAKRRLALEKVKK